MNRKFRRFSAILTAFLLAFMMFVPAGKVHAEPAEKITILHTNDVHCGINGYAKLAAYKKSLSNVVLVDAGDHVQGEVIGTLTEGQKIVELMNAVGYDLAVPGNHEFDYQMPAFLEVVKNAKYPYISANFTKADGTKIENIDPYKILTIGEHKIAFVGICTPETYTKSTPVYFQDGNGNWVYTFNENDLNAKVQEAVDAAKAEGAELVVAVGHTGIDGTDERWASDTIIAGTNGIDIYIDGHSHETAEYMTYPNKDGNAVLYQQTGTKLENIGQIDITFSAEGNKIEMKLVKVSELKDIDEDVQKIIDAANKEVDDYFGQVIGSTDFKLYTHTEDGKTRKVRNSETNMGDFNADAYRILTGADIALIQGGGIRAEVGPGEITRKAITAVNPWMNALVKVEATGQQILDALEHGARNYPGENGGFFQVSGLTYEINTDVASTVETDDQGMFKSVKGERRVQNVMIGSEPLDVAKKYSVVSTEYILLQSGDGMTMFNGVKVLEEYDDPDSEFLVKYLTETLKGKVPEEYKEIGGQGRIKFVTNEEEETDTVTILHTNDVHCGINGYSKLAAYKKSLTNVLLFDAGDHAQGEVIGTLTEGQKIVELMNATGYDLAVPGNHEFDYQMPAFLEIVKNANYPYISANFTKANGSKIEDIEPYKIFTVNGHKIGVVGICTPETYTKSTPVYFQDGDGNWVYTFNENNLNEKVQKAVDAVKAEGVEVVIAVAHTGIDGTDERWASDKIIAATTGIDIYLDGHSHEVAENKTFNNKDGKPVHYQQTGTKLENIGQVDITFGKEGLEVAMKLVKVEELKDIDEDVQKIIDEANKMVDDYFGEVIGKSDFVLTIKDENGNRKVRSGETNMGDFNADAYRLQTGADIALMQGGGVRADVGPGDITRKDITAVNPWMNALVKVEATGQQILDALEHGARNYPKENGGFFQVSGLSYEINETVESPVLTDDQGMFLGIEEGKQRRVQNVRLANGRKLDPEKKYSVVSTEYILLQSGDGMTMFKGVEVLEEYDQPDSEFLVNYLMNYLNGVVPEEYKEIDGQGRIVITDKEPEEGEYYFETGKDAVWNKGMGDLVFVVKRTENDETTFDRFVSVLFDDQEIDPSIYTAEPGSVKITFPAELLKDSEEGSGTITVVFNDGEVSTTLTITAVPNTGDANKPVLYAILLTTALTAAAGAAVIIKRRKED